MGVGVGLGLSAILSSLPGCAAPRLAAAHCRRARPLMQQQLLSSRYLPGCALPVHGAVSTAPVQRRRVFACSLLVVRPLDGP